MVGCKTGVRQIAIPSTDEMLKLLFSIQVDAYQTFPDFRIHAQSRRTDIHECFRTCKLVRRHSFPVDSPPAAVAKLDKTTILMELWTILDEPSQYAKVIAPPGWIPAKVA